MRQSLLRQAPDGSACSIPPEHDRARGRACCRPGLHSLGNRAGNGVLGVSLISKIGKAGGKTPCDIGEPASLRQQQQHGAAKGCHLSSVEGTNGFASSVVVELAMFRDEFCLNGVGLPRLCVSL